MKANERTKFLLILLFGIILVLAFFVVKPFLISILISGVLAFLLYPIYQFFFSKTRNRYLSASIISVVVLLGIILPTVFFLNIAAKEARLAYIGLKDEIHLWGNDCDEQESFACELLGSFGDVSTKYYVEKALENLASAVITMASNFALAIPLMIANFFLILFTTFYLCIDAEKIIAYIRSILPYKETEKDKILSEVYGVTHGIIHGTFLLSVIEGILAWIAFFLAGVPGALVWSILIFIFGFIPMIGPSIIWIPAFVFLLIQNKIGASIIILFSGIILVIIDNLLRPSILGDKTKIHPVMILLGMLGGIALFGFIGVVIGPLILSLAILLIEIFVDNAT